MYANIEEKKHIASTWFRSLRDMICSEFESIEQEYNSSERFQVKPWDREGGGKGEISVIKGKVLEKAGVNVSTVFGQFSENFKKEISGAEENPNFWASGISLVVHPVSPFVPAAHMNTRMLITNKATLAGVADLNPIFEDTQDTLLFHSSLKEACDQYDIDYYPKFKQICDEYFYIKHRKETRGVGGIFYEYLNTGDWEHDFGLTKAIGQAFAKVYSQLIRKHMFKNWTHNDREQQLIKRGKYVEYNLIYDRGTKFGLMTGADPEAYLMPLPPEAKWI